MSTTLYHYCCSHSRARIGKKGILRPHHHPLLETPLIWLTDMELPDAQALGLTSTILACDRTEIRYRAIGRAEPWRVWADRRALPAAVRTSMEHGRKPERWWVSEAVMRCRLDPIRQEVRA